MSHLNGKTVFITGGAGGLGKAIGEELLKKSAKVCLADCNENGLVKAVTELKEKFEDVEVIYCICDVTSEVDFENALKKTKTTFGHLDILINNAAITDENNFCKLIDVNLKGVMIGTNLGLRLLSDKGGNRKGHIINTASTAALIPSPLTPAYHASKAAVLSYTRSVGAPVYAAQTGIKVNAICPGEIDTDFLSNYFNTSLNPELLRKAISKKHGDKKLSPKYVAEQFVKVLEDDETGEALLIQVDKKCSYLPKVEVVWE